MGSAVVAYGLKQAGPKLEFTRRGIDCEGRNSTKKQLKALVGVEDAAVHFISC